MVARMQEGQTDANAEQLYVWSRRWMDAERAASKKHTERVAAVEAHLARMKDLERLTTAHFNTGQVTSAQRTAAEFYRLEAELLLSKSGAE